MMKSGFMRVLGMASWLITALAAINLGLKPFNYDFFNMSFMQNIANPVYYVVLAAGILSLVFFFMAGSSCCCGPHSHGTTTYPK